MLIYCIEYFIICIVFLMMGMEYLIILCMVYYIICIICFFTGMEYFINSVWNL